MYLWVVIAIFISALAALSTSLRPDVKEVYLNTQAEVETTRVYTLHRAAMKYFNNHNKEEGDIPYASLTSGYLPYGFNSGTVSSMLYCLNEGGTNIPNDCQVTNPPDNEHEEEWISSDNTCCQHSGDSNYLITYAPIPAKWLDIRSGLPRSEILDAMRDKFGYVDGFGYSVDNDADDPYMGENNEFQNLISDRGIVSESSRSYYSIPQYVIEHNDDFDDNGQCAGDGNYCLVYITRIQ